MFEIFGGAEGSRTLDLLNAIQALSQLSYGPIGFVPPNSVARAGTLIRTGCSGATVFSNAGVGQDWSSFLVEHVVASIDVYGLVFELVILG